MAPEAAADHREGLPEEAEVRGRVDRLRAHGLKGTSFIKEFYIVFLSSFDDT